ncbi:CRP/FNR family transcriptional regulator, anaerobic regulatory protein [Thiothrix caldifontis]|uniref:CRP/FNR family transcriptional regulator, anaerobic regulatory protein n=1 Tax=Thiothrix caldifontis TaxID=525918 RepID=A0A1H3YI43_9GAMM|nr:Crp/Fnr family transcriptional regulator [Thiothrix caldifontis]SEA11217.1 CRP/FNR family transcriptional regulator, anaerobic regulatory protein [Thiothrix caldifontis]
MESQVGNKQAKKCSLDEFALFAELGSKFSDALKSVASEMLEYMAAETIYAAGVSAQHFYILHDGYVKLFKTTSNGKDQIIRIVKAGEIFGFDGFVDIRYNHSAVPLKYATVCRVPVEQLNALGESRAEVERLIMMHCIKELQHADERLLELGAKRSQEKLASFLLAWCNTTPVGEWTPLVLSRLDIAQLLGLTIETVSRLFAQWKREGVVIERHQALQIVDLQKLTLVAHSHE